MNKNGALLLILGIMFGLNRFLTSMGVPQKISFATSFLAITVTAIYYSNIKMKEMYGEVRAVKLYTYGMLFVVIFCAVMLILTD